MPNLFLNLPVPASTGAGAAVDVSQMGATKTLIVGGSVKGAVTLEYATDDVGAVWAPVPNGSFLGPGRVTIDLAAHWMRAVMDGSGSMNADVGAPQIPALFAQIGPAPVDISAMATFKTVVSPAALLVEVSEDGVSWSQAFSFPQKGGSSAVVVAKLARCLTGTVWMAAAPTGDQPADDVDTEFPQPFTSPQTTLIIYVRATGSDATGDGKTIPTAYRTIQRAVLDVPLHVPGGVQYRVDCTDLIDGGPELFPPQYQFPRWVSGRAFDAGDLTDPQFLVQCAVNIRAELRSVPALGSDAVIQLADLLATDVGGGITAVTNSNPAEVTTTNPHGLFLVQDEDLQQVTIVGVLGAVSANGTWFVEATGPNTFLIKGSDTSADPPYTPATGTASTLFVQDQNSGQVQVKLAVARASWVAGSLKGKQFLDPAGEHSVVYNNTDDTLFLTTVVPPTIAPGSPGIIAEQSAALQASPNTTFGFVGGINVINQDSLALDGLAIFAAGPFDRGLFHFGGNVWVQGCHLTNPGFSRVLQANSGHTWMVGAEQTQTRIYQSSGLFESYVGFGVDWWECFGGTVFIDPIFPLGGMDDGGFIGWFGVKVINPPDFAFGSTAPHGQVNRLSIENGQAGAIIIDGTGGGFRLNGVGGDWAGNGLQAFAGAQIEVSNATFNDDFSAGPNDMVVGTLPVRTFANFRSAADGGFQLQQMDLTAFNANVAPPGPATFGIAGSGARVFQIPFII